MTKVTKYDTGLLYVGVDLGASNGDRSVVVVAKPVEHEGGGVQILGGAFAELPPDELIDIGGPHVTPLQLAQLQAGAYGVGAIETNADMPDRAYAGFNDKGAMVSYNQTPDRAAREAHRNVVLASCIGRVVDTRMTLKQWLLSTTALQSV